MPKRKNYDNDDLNQEFDAIYSKVDLYIISPQQPTNPKMGMQWFDPNTGNLSIWDGHQFIIK